MGLFTTLFRRSGYTVSTETFFLKARFKKWSVKTKCFKTLPEAQSFLRGVAQVDYPGDQVIHLEIHCNKTRERVLHVYF